MREFLLITLLVGSFTVSAEEIRGDKNHDGVLSGEEQFLRDYSQPVSKPETQKTVPKKTVPRSFPTVPVTEINTGYTTGWVARKDGLQLDPERLKYLQSDILHASTGGYKERTEQSNAIVQERSNRETIARTIELAQRDNVDMETLLWRLKIEGYKHIMPPMMVIQDAGATLNSLQSAKLIENQQRLNYAALLDRQARLSTPISPQSGQPYYYPQQVPMYYGYAPQGQITTPEGQLPLQSDQPYYYQQSVPMYYGYAPQGQIPIQNPPPAPTPSIRERQLEYNYGCNLPTVIEGRLVCR